MRFGHWKRFPIALLVAMTLGALAVAAPPPGKGGGNGGDDGSSATPPVTYEVIWLRGFRAIDTYAIGVNQFGKVVGSYYDDQEVLRPFVYSALSGMQNLDDIVDAMEVELKTSSGSAIDLRQGFTLRSAQKINNAGRISGGAIDSLGDRYAFVLDESLDPALQFAPMPAGCTYTTVVDMSENGWVLVYAEIPGGIRLAFAWNPGASFVELPMESGFGYSGINSLGQVVGGRGSAVVRLSLDDLLSPEILSDSTNSQPSINDLGDVAANVPGTTKKTKNRLYPQVYQDGIGWQRIGTTPFSSRTVKINNRGQVCGKLFLNDLKKPDTVYVYDPTDGFWSVDDLVGDTESLWFAGDYVNDNIPEDMSEVDSGYPLIVGHKFIDGEGPVGFLLTPLP